MVKGTMAPHNQSGTYTQKTTSLQPVQLPQSVTGCSLPQLLIPELNQVEKSRYQETCPMAIVV